MTALHCTNWGKPKRAPHLSYCCTKSSLYIYVPFVRPTGIQFIYTYVPFVGPAGIQFIYTYVPFVRPTGIQFIYTYVPFVRPTGIQFIYTYVPFVGPTGIQFIYTYVPFVRPTGIQFIYIHTCRSSVRPASNLVPRRGPLNEQRANVGPASNDSKVNNITLKTATLVSRFS